MSIQKTKLAELNSNISTIYSDNAPRTPLSIDALTSKSNLGFKKFARKRDTSIDVIKKCLQEKNAPKKTINKKQDKQYLNKTLDSIQESQISKIIKSNSFIKFFNTPCLNPKIGTFQLDKMNSRISQQTRCQKKKQRNSFSMNNFEVKKTEQKKKPLTIQQFDEFSTPRNSKKEIPNKKTSKIVNYEISYTQRQKSLKLPNPQIKEIKILQNEIIILEDENTRLRNQINDLVHEKQEYMAKKNEIERYIKDLQNQLNYKKKAEIDFLEYIISNFHQIYLQIIKILQDNRLQKNINSSIGSNEEDIFSSIKKNKITIENFSQLFMEPAKHFINEKIKDYSQLFEHSKVELNKLQIRQNVMLRSSFQLQNSKFQNKMLNEKLSAEKSKSLKFKQMYEKLKNTQEQGKSMTKKKINLSQNCLQFHQKNSKGNQETSFILSDLSDEQQPKLNNKRMIKKM